MSVLRQIEAGIGSHKGNVEECWENAPKGMQDLQRSSLESIYSIMKVQSILLKRYEKSGTTHYHNIMLWAFIGLLNLPSAVFHKLISISLDLILVFVSAGSALVTNAFLSQVARFQERQFGIQQLLVAHFSNESSMIREKAALLLFKSRLIFPANAVDSNSTGIMYTILYLVTWIFVAVEEDNIHGPNFLVIAGGLKDVLLSVEVNRFAEAQDEIQGLITIVQQKQVPEGEIIKKIFAKCASNIFEPFIFDYGNNLAAYSEQLMSRSAGFRTVGLRMFKVLTLMAKKNNIVKRMSTLANVTSRLPYLVGPSSESDAVIGSVVEDETETMHRDIDLSSHGKVELLPTRNPHMGSVKSTAAWFSKELGIEASNRMYGLM